MPRHRVLMIGSEDLGWAELRTTFREIAGVEVIEAGMAKNAVAEAAALKPTVIVIASMLHGRPSLPLIQALRAACPASKVAVFAASLDHAHAGDLLALARLGVVAYLIWADLTRLTLAAVAALLLDASVRITSSAVAEVFLAEQERRLHPRWDEASLTGREAAILARVVEGRSNKEIAAQLHVSHRTVEDHVRRLTAQLKARNRTHLAAIAVQLGLVDR